MVNGEGTAWCTLREAGERLNLSRGALRRRIARGLLEHRKSNDGMVRVLIPSELEPAPGQAGQARAGSVPPGHGHLLGQLAEARVEAALARGELAAEARRSTDLLGVISDLRADRDRLAAELAEARKGWLERLLEAVRRK
jgi:hypothetical protein